MVVNTVEEVLTTFEIRLDDEGFDSSADINPVELARFDSVGRQADSEYQGMGMPCLALILNGGNAFMAHVGDFLQGYFIYRVFYSGRQD